MMSRGRLERYAQPVHRRRADRLHQAVFDQLLVNFRGSQQRLPAVQHVFGQPLAGLLRRGGLVEFIGVIGKAEQVGCLIIQGDIKVLGRHQLRDDGMDQLVKLPQLFGGMRGFGDAVKGRLDLIGAFVFGEVIRVST